MSFVTVTVLSFVTVINSVFCHCVLFCLLSLCSFLWFVSYIPCHCDQFCLLSLCFVLSLVIVFSSVLCHCSVISLFTVSSSVLCHHDQPVRCRGVCGLFSLDQCICGLGKFRFTPTEPVDIWSRNQFFNYQTIFLYMHEVFKHCVGVKMPQLFGKSDHKSMFVFACKGEGDRQIDGKMLDKAFCL